MSRSGHRAGRELRPGASVALGLGAVLLCGCLSTAHEPAVQGRRFEGRIEPRPVPASIYYRPLERPPEVLRSARSRAGFWPFDVELPSVGANRQPGNALRGTYFRSAAGGRRPLVLILPIWGASDFPSNTTGRRLTSGRLRGGVHVLVLEGPNQLFDWRRLARAATREEFWQGIERGVRVTQTMLADLRRLLDWAEARPEVDSRRIAVVGFSRGALLASQLMGLDDRVSAGVFAMGGAQLHRMLASCPNSLELTRDHVARRFGWDAETYSALLEPRLRSIEPAAYLGRIDSRSVLVVEAAYDGCMGGAGREEFWRALGRPERILIGGRHRSSFLTMTFLNRGWTTRRIAEFLERKLLGEEAPLRGAPRPEAGSRRRAFTQ